MSYAESILPEFDLEMASTRKVLERIPEDKLDWQAHPKSHTIGWNANHLANLPHWVVVTLTQPSLDVAPVGGEPFSFPNLTNRSQILEAFDQNVASARQVIQTITDDQVREPWTLSRAGVSIFTMPRTAVVRRMVMNHIIHHRAIMCVYLRLNDVSVPGIYGPSGDE
jgi:uncharacterized damage-inducible protein DinB